MVSVIIVCHNYGMYLSECIKSILTNKKQYLKEIIIIDDSSSDNTFLISKLWAKKNNKIKVYKKYFRSLAKSTNFGIKKSKSNWVTKIDADDFVSKTYLEDFVKEIKSKKLDFVYGDLIEYHNSKKKKKIKQNYPINNLLKYPVGSGTVINKKFWKKLNGFNEKLYYQDDFDFWLKVKKDNKFAKGYLNKANYFYRKHNNNMSKSFFKKNFTKILIIIKNLI